MANDQKITDLVDHLFREEAGRITAILTRIFGFKNSDLIEDIVQDTFITALKTWPLKGKPRKPSAWLMQVAKNKTINAVKRDRRFIQASLVRDGLKGRNDQPEKAVDVFFLENEIKDSQLRILFACCNPAFSRKVQIALTLKTVSGFSNAEIARALLMNEPAVKKMIYRARKSIRNEELSFGVPFINETEERLDTVRAVCYLIFNEGYKRSEGDRLIKKSLCWEAIRLTYLLYSMKKEVAKSSALLSLMLFNTARFPARLDEQGCVVDLESQDRSLWDERLIQKGFHFMEKARETQSLSRYHLEAGIASAHSMAKTYQETDWKIIVSYYRKLLQMVDNPVTELNYAIALSNLKGPEAGLKALDECKLQKPLEQYFLLHAAKADMYFRWQKYGRAKRYYQLALDLAEAKSDKQFILSKIEECDMKQIHKN